MGRALEMSAPRQESREWPFLLSLFSGQFFDDGKRTDRYSAIKPQDVCLRPFSRLAAASFIVIPNTHPVPTTASYLHMHIFDLCLG